MKRKTFRDLLSEQRSIVLPAAHDALSARLVEQAGFQAVAISGSATLACRYGLPDLGIVGLSDMIAATRDVLAATSLPCLGDGDDGYGDLRSVARTILENEGIGMSALVLEDQLRSVKQPGQGPATGVADIDDMAAKLRIAAETRDSADFWIFGRTDSYSTLGLDAAMARADRFLSSGADGVFIAGVRKEADLVGIGRRFSGVPMVAVVYGGKDWPDPSVADLTALGFTHIVYPLALILPVCLAIGNALEKLRAAQLGGVAPAALADEDRARRYLAQAIQLDKWSSIA
jgi:2-methylisocitrate lyase-like PEP mutase family enzyme